MTDVLISVIMLVHNREEYVGQAIESILSQTYKNIEFIIVINGSTDNSEKIVKSYAVIDNRIRILHCNSGHIGEGRNVGLDHIQGQFFTFIDDDDYCSPDYVEFLLELIEANGADIAVCGSFYDNGGTISDKYVYGDHLICSREEGVSYFLQRKFFNSSNATKLFRNTDQFKRIRYDSDGKYDDIHTVYKYFVNAKRRGVAVEAYGLPKYYVRRHDNNNSSETQKHKMIKEEWLREYLCAYRERTEYIVGEMPELKEIAVWSEWSFMLSMIEKIERYQLADCKVYLEYMRNELKQNQAQFMGAKWTRDFERDWMVKYV